MIAEFPIICPGAFHEWVIHIYIDLFSVLGSDNGVGSSFTAIRHRDAAVFHFPKYRPGSFGEQVNGHCCVEIRFDSGYTGDPEEAVDVFGDLGKACVDAVFFTQVDLDELFDPFDRALIIVQCVHLCAKVHKHFRRCFSHTA